MSTYFYYLQIIKITVKLKLLMFVRSVADDKSQHSDKTTGSDDIEDEYHTDI